MASRLPSRSPHDVGAHVVIVAGDVPERVRVWPSTIGHAMLREWTISKAGRSPS
jgi:hypothetical protein